jgi:FkbM family methyltransferase
MKLQNIPSKVVNWLVNYIYSLARKDSISGAKIVGRDDLKELGTKYGSWVVPSNEFKSDSICYCVGCGEDISFDLSVIDCFGCDVYGFDPTPRSIAYVQKIAGENPKYHFYDVGLWDKEDTLKFFVPKNPSHVSHSLVNLQKTEEYLSINVQRLSHIMKDLGHENIDLLKIDIEGAEYKVIESVIEDDIDVKIICVEYDERLNPLDNKYKERIRNSINSLIEAGYSLVCAQGNGNYTFMKNA